MRKVLFRGKRINSGQWVYGYYVKAKMHWHKHGIHEDFIVCNAIQNGGYFNFMGRYAVDPKTIGQYTGLTDKNGKKIFEGDIIDTPDRLCKVYWFEKNAQFDLSFIRNAHNKRIINFKGIAMRDLSDYEIIGNIYDNPELLRSEIE